MGELRQRGTVWWIRYYRDGRRYEESTGSERKGVAVDLLKIREGDGAKGLPVTPKIARLRFDAAAADVVNDYKINGRRTLADVERRITLHLLPVFGGQRMTAITTADLRAFAVQRVDAGASPAEVNRELAIIKRAYRLALQAGKLLHSPYVPMLAERNVRQGFFELETFAAVRAALPAALQGVVTFGYLTGWRVQSEVLPLTWAQVDRTAQTIRLEPGETKNAEGRTLPYGGLPELAAVIDTQWIARAQLLARETICPYVFHRNGAPIRQFRKAWAAACTSAGCPGRLIHDLRRTGVRNLVRAGVPEKTAMAITGHKTRSVFDRYDIISEDDLRTAIGKLADAAGTGTKKGQSARAGRVVRMRPERKAQIS
jgi:integrase